MHDSGALTWREVVDKHHAAMIDELALRVDSHVHDAVSQALIAERAAASTNLARACDEARRTHAEALNQTLRRLRNATAEQEILALFHEGCGFYAGLSVVVVFESGQARVAVSSPGITPDAVFDIAAAPALVSAIETRDPIVALAAGGEISPVLADAFGTAEGARVYLFPVVARHSVVAMLIAQGPAVSAPVELLCQAAGMRLESLAPARAGAAPDLVQFTHPMVPASSTSAPRSWNDLSQDDQKLHLQAQRMARVRVAEIRLKHEQALKLGIASGTIYAALQAPIDAARRQFLQSFLAKTPTMVDYLHLEILRSLAHDDDRLLGDQYPGPMV